MKAVVVLLLFLQLVALSLAEQAWWEPFGKDTPDEFKSAVLAGADMNSKDNASKTPLIHAAGDGDMAFVQWMITKGGADTNVKDNYDMRGILLLSYIKV